MLLKHSEIIISVFDALRKGKMKRTIIEFFIGLPIVVLLYTLLDYLYCTFITQSAFVFEPKGCAMAVTVWIAVVAVLYLLRIKKQK